MATGGLGGIVERVKTAVSYGWKGVWEVRGASQKDPGESLSLNIASGE